MPQGFQSVREIMVNGGPVLFILLLMSVGLGALIIERVMSFRKSIVDQEWLTQQMAIQLLQGKLKDALQFVEGIEGSLARVYEVGLKRYHEPRELMENAMKVSIARQALLMEKNISHLGTLAVVCPFVGLFGTVVGIMHAFASIATKGGTGAAAVAGGVSEALITTAAGLGVAIAAVVAFNYFKGRIKTALDEMLIHVEVFSDMVTYVKEGKPFPEDLKELLDLPVLGEAPGERSDAAVPGPYAALQQAPPPPPPPHPAPPNLYPSTGPAAPPAYPSPPGLYPPGYVPQGPVPGYPPAAAYPQQHPGVVPPGYPPAPGGHPSSYPPPMAGPPSAPPPYPPPEGQ